MQAAGLIHQHYPKIQFVLPFANKQLKEQYSELVNGYSLPIEMTLKGSGAALQRSTLSLIASGTAALEAMIYGSMMVVVYKLGWLSHFLYNRFKHIDHFSLPNQLLSSPEVPELSQADVTPENIFAAARQYLDDPEKVARLAQEFSDVSAGLRQNTDQLAAGAVLKLIDSPQ